MDEFGLPSEVWLKKLVASARKVILCSWKVEKDFETEASKS